MYPPLNTQVAMKLQEMSDLLEQQGANPFRVNAYRRAGQTLLGLQRGVAEILEQEGLKGLVALPGVGKGIAASILEIVTTGRWAQLDRLRGSLDPVHLFQTVPGIGSKLAEHIHESLHIDTLEALESAAYDGRLSEVKGIGQRRLNILQTSLAAMLGRTRRREPRVHDDGPEVSLLLRIDRLYLEQAVAGELPVIAPRRFNPEGTAWLPILHTDQDGWHFTAMYSNTARAHQLKRTRDWVVIYFYDEHHQEGQVTTVTETHGPLIGRRVVRGREQACHQYYLTAAQTGMG
ncbi:MAG: DNA-binding protein [Gammaproteobacteria bacterium]|nr:DNA-binding protein [Gammaproteobacteria bacterium]